MMKKWNLLNEKKFAIYLCIISFLMMPSNHARACDEGFAAFEKTVFLKVRKDCAKCHDGSKPSAPPFAVADSRVSYESLLSYMNFSSIEESLLVIRAGNGHCASENCEEDSGKEMAKLAKEWWDTGEKTCFRNGKYFTEQIEIPKVLPTVNEGYTPMLFDLGKINPKFKGVFFQIEIQEYQAAAAETKGAYRVKSPRLLNGSASMALKDIKVLLNGKYDPIYNAFTTVSKSTSFLPNFISALGKIKTATPMLSGQTMILLKDGLPQSKLSISFVDIQESSPTGCYNEKFYSSDVQPLLTKLDCASCHNNSGTFLGSQILNMNKPPSQICKVASEYLNDPFPVSSAFVSFPLKGIGNHPVIANDQQVLFIQTIKNWLK